MTRNTVYTQAEMVSAAHTEQVEQHDEHQSGLPDKTNIFGKHKYPGCYKHIHERNAKRNPKLGLVSGSKGLEIMNHWETSTLALLVAFIEFLKKLLGKVNFGSCRRRACIRR